MKVLHVLDHSLPIVSGYSVRSRSIVAFQARLGLEPVVLTSAKQGASSADAEITPMFVPALTNPKAKARSRRGNHSARILAAPG